MAIHPLHPALAHFPIGAWGIATGLDVVALTGWKTDIIWPASTALNALGLGLALLTMTAGAWDLAKLIKKQNHLLDRALRHVGIMALTWCLYLAALILRIDHGELAFVSIVPVGVSVIGFVGLMLGGWFGGDLVYGHGANVVPVSKPDN